MIEIQGVTKRFGAKAAVQGLDLFVPRGRVFGLIGPNGAGKTTTLKMLATLIKPDEGRISIDGLDIRDDVVGVRRGIGYMPDAFGGFADLSVEEYLEFFGRAYGLAAGALAGRVEAALELTDLRGLRGDSTAALSTGMRQRLCLAKTLVHDPAVLILDEPASGLDPRARVEIRGLLRELGDMGKTVVISSHILVDLEEICSDIGIIEAGSVVWQGPIKDGLARPDGHIASCRVQVRAEAAERALALLARLDFVAAARAQGAEIRIELRGAGANQVLAVLIQAGIEIVAFKQESFDLEALFLHRTRGMLQ